MTRNRVIAADERRMWRRTVVEAPHTLLERGRDTTCRGALAGSQLADTTVNTIRHCHRLGLLDEPERRHNGYKRYEVRHLVSLLRIRCLAELGVPLAQIGDVSPDTDSTPGALRNLDAELQRRIERLKKARTDIATILRARAPADVPAGFESVAARLSEADSSMIHINGQLYDQNALADVQKMVEADTDDVSADIDRLPADADEETRKLLVERLARILVAQTLPNEHCAS
ncbi:MerR family transcriptional regulator [Streptomyces sp. NPDC059679]|uniref:MerR family transcriptional regulator n=1 Tax=Streptomyces sp. NPDC059679 TaxID=3346903 RepID=UPI0036805A9A